MTYDGYGRLKTKHVPEQNAGAVTTWDYNVDDTIQKITDARGASQTFGYNNRHLPISITYAAPTGSGITVPAAVSFTYDAARNRTAMNDGSGGTSYTYDQLSRLTSEGRTFTGLSGSFSISYGYNLANQLTSLAEPTQFGSTFSYVRDAAGRLVTVNGSPFEGVTNYASNAQYRAWGSLKHINFGNGKSLDITYSSRLQTATFQVSGLMAKSYDYYADGSLRFSSESTSNAWDRFYSYDHAGRMKEAFSGAEARFEGLTNNRPYRQTFSYDAIGHLTERTSNIWSSSFSSSDSYINNRRSGWSYDADGRLISGPNTYTYDARGEIHTIDLLNPTGSTVRFLDGDGRQVKAENSVFDEQTWSWVTTTTYYLRSSVLQGRVLTEINSSGAKKRTFVYADGNVMAWQVFYGSVPGVMWEHRDASGASFRTTNSEGNLGTEPDELPAEVDPTGANAFLPPVSEPPQGENDTLTSYPMFSDPRNPGVTYSVDGLRVPVDYFMRMVNLAFHGNLGLVEAISRQSAPRFRDFDTRVEDDSSMAVLAMLLALEAAKPQESAMEIARRKNCATPNSIVEQFKTQFEAHWNRTNQSGEENGSLIFYEAATNTYPVVKLSEGRHLRFGRTQYGYTVPAMPEIGPETSRALADFRNAKRTVSFLAFFHTHPNYPGGDSRSGDPTFDDIQYQRSRGNPLGIIRTGQGYSFFSNGKTFRPDDPKANDCIWQLNTSRT